MVTAGRGGGGGAGVGVGVGAVSGPPGLLRPLHRDLAVGLRRAARRAVRRPLRRAAARRATVRCHHHSPRLPQRDLIAQARHEQRAVVVYLDPAARWPLFHHQLDGGGAAGVLERVGDQFRGQ
ncbi:hypothetical protein HEP86_30620 [Streptomyces sp. RPA4-5]|uniref:hypothetical protein n=1 Tax=Streptomyces sp. RPA4-5 TaxID=2721245 RepID=UPI00143E39F6|nr:hypothetical protein [Streptomyces sp. RPA4-5]QIY58075.1 hypothetical protein HEP86_30620 [Streptomyces sp. RPA4-5]